MRKILALLLLYSAALSATTITGKVKSPNGYSFNGTVTFCLNVAGAQDPTGAGFVMVPNCTPPIAVLNGSVAANTTLSGNDVIQPAGTVYLAYFRDSYGAPKMQNVYRVTGASFDIGAAIPTNITTNNVSYANPLVATGKIYGFYYIDGVNFPTIQSGITAACTANPAGGTVYVPPGTYVQNTQFTGLCASLYLVGAGRNTCDQAASPTTITTTITSGDLFLIDSLDHVHVSGMCFKNTGAGGGVPLHCVGCRFGLFQDLYFTGPWANGIVVSPKVGTVSAIWNTFRNIHHTGYQTGAAMVLLDALNTTSQVLNNNKFEYMTGQGGNNGFGVKLKATGGICPFSNVFINENSFSAGQDSAPGLTGTGISADNCTFRDLYMDTQTIEGSNLSISIGTGNAGFTCLACEISANTINVPVDNSGPLGRTFITGNIGGATQQTFGVDALGNTRVNGLCIGGLAGCVAGNIQGSPGMIIQASGNGALTINASNISVGQQIALNGNTFTNGGGTQTMPSATGTLAETNVAQSWSGNQTGIPLVLPTIGGGSGLNLYAAATDTPGAITVNAQTCTDRGVAITGSLTSAKIIAAANYALEAGILVGLGQAVAGTAHYRICNVTVGNITLAAGATFNVAVWQ